MGNRINVFVTNVKNFSLKMYSARAISLEIDGNGNVTVEGLEGSDTVHYLD